NIFIPDGVYRITDCWYIGGPVASIPDLYFNSNIVELPSFNSTNHINSRLWTPIKIIGSGKTHIHGDFVADELKAIVYYNLQGGNANGKTGDLYTGEFSDIGIHSKGRWTGTNTYVPPTATDVSNNQVGFAAINTIQLKIQNISLVGLKVGMLHNNCYFSYTNKIYFEYCIEGYTNLTSSGSLLENFIAYYCDTGYNIRSGQVHMSSINIEHCKKGLWINASNIVINGSYLEQIVGAPEAALLIGLDTTDVGYTLEGATDRISINGLTIAGGGGASIWMKKSARRLYINSGNVNGALGIKLSDAGNKIFAYSCQGVSATQAGTPFLGTIYQRNESFEAEAATTNSLKVRSLLEVEGDSQVATLTSSGTMSVLAGQTIRGEIKQEHFIPAGAVNHPVRELFLPIGIGALDKILVLGKFSAVDNTRINGRVNIIAGAASSLYTPTALLDISFMNDAVGRFSVAVSLLGSVDSNTYSLVTYDKDGVTYIGIRILSTTTARIPSRFHFSGLLKSSNDYTFTVIDSSTVSVISIYVPNSNSSNEIHVSRLLVPTGKVGIGIGVNGPTAKVHLGAGSSQAGNSPLKFTTGAMLSSPEDGAMEYYNGVLYFTAGLTRRKIQLESSSQIQNLTYSSSVVWDYNVAPNAKLLLSGNSSLSITNLIAGSSGKIIVVQDGTGNRSLNLPVGTVVANGGAGSISLSTAANSVDILAFFYDGTKLYWKADYNFT
ncbi:hypothetical protein, partial [Flavihumibacter sp. CACIAM 22H1]|uniref:hypothetical protein n=1 Tax=Flavihumibacter sp. CACIAM 22H1 TaxID=1812911 RepID=UPI0025B9DB59